MKEERVEETKGWRNEALEEREGGRRKHARGRSREGGFGKERTGERERGRENITKGE